MRYYAGSVAKKHGFNDALRLISVLGPICFAGPLFANIVRSETNFKPYSDHQF